MICVKFGGSCVTAKNLGCIANIVDDNVGAVVVSAVGKEFLNDNKLTDLLDEYYRTREQTIWQQICDKIMRLCVLNSIDVDFEKMLFEAKSRIDGRDRYYCLSIGEEITARCVAKYLGRRYVESAEYVVFTNGRLNNAETKRRIGQLVGQKFVCGGFYGGDRKSVV